MSSRRIRLLRTAADLGVRFAVALLVWMLLAALLARRRVLSFRLGAGALGFGPTFVEHLLSFALWALFTLPILALARRFPLIERPIGRALAVHLVCGLGVAFAHLQLDTFLLGQLPWNAIEPTGPLGGFGDELLVYAAIVGGWNALAAYRRSRERALRAAELELQAAQLREGLASAELATLRTQLNPHFLFNTLNTIAVLMTEDVAAANRMLLRLGELLRASLASTRAQEVALRDELEFVRGYLEIEGARFQDRLDVHIDVEPAALDARVPSMLLQPLVENAIRHGIAPRVEGGTVEIRARRLPGAVELVVRDDGLGLEAPGQPGSGVGLANTRARLAQLYGAAHRFELADGEEGGLVVTIVIPTEGSHGRAARADRGG
jgi:hypothetical protein